MAKQRFELCPGVLGGDIRIQIGKQLTETLSRLTRCEAGVERAPNPQVTEVRHEYLRAAAELETDDLSVGLLISVMCDLWVQGWEFDVNSETLTVDRPNTAAKPLEEKQRIRNGLLVERDAQLRESPVAAFILKMEQRRLWKGHWHSIFSLMRDGRELADGVRDARYLQGKERLAALQNVIDPYLQLVDDSRCEFTGLLLKDIWRYCRHSWVLPYQSTPGRNLWLLVRDRAAPNHPVVGIAALGSAIVQLTQRDNWVGWTPARFLDLLRASPTQEAANWVHTSLTQQFDELYTGDFMREGVLTPDLYETPDEALIARLRRIALEAKEAHQLYPKATVHKVALGQTGDWLQQAESYLFRAKRAELLATLLKDRAALRSAGFGSPSVESLQTALHHAGARAAIGSILRRVKASHVGNDVMDITVCGAVPPYNALLGGKLVALLVTSPEVSDAYSRRYAATPSIIASSMAGRPIYRKPSLVLLGTTSLYGVGSSQYNRLSIPGQAIGADAETIVRYHELGHSKGYGSYHFSDATLELMERLVARNKNGRRVNSVFGEGVNPRLRKIRDALSIAGMNAEELLEHGNARLIYGVPLAHNFREVLLGFESGARSYYPNGSPEKSTERVAAYWRQRWLAKRINSDEVLQEVASHTLTYPVRHGARVQVPEELEEGTLFARD